MALPYILKPPVAETGWQEWLFHHARDHEEIIDAVRSQFNIILPTYNLDQFLTDDQSVWMQVHQQSHSDMNRLFGIGGSDLEVLDWKKPNEVDAWMWLNFNEHQGVRSILKI